jgi:sporulation and spore germination protein/immunoglobulin-like protein involved in spore germination
VKTRAIVLMLVLVVALVAGAGRANAGASTTDYQVWFERGGKLWLAKRVMPTTTTPGKATIQSLLAGPNAAEADAGVGTRVPDRTSLVGIALNNGTATVELSREFGDSNGARMRIAQVVRTLTQFKTIDRVKIRVGTATLGPYTRESTDTLLPAILVWNPAIGSHLTGSVRVTGSANVFEAALTIRVLNERGHSIATVHTTASCGTGCRGGYTVKLPFKVRHDQLGAIVVFDDDSDGDGQPSNLVRVPVVLTAK